MKLSLRFYFHKVKIEGAESVPKNTPLIVAPNHQNAFLDALLVGAFIPIPLHYLARQDVFNRWTKSILSILQMIPIYRIRDGYSKLSLNDSIFESCFELFRGKESVLIFAEGNHGRYHFLRPLTKGAARLSLQAQSRLSEDLMILPVGLNYFDHQSPKSTVLIKFGEPIPVKDYLEIYEKNQAKGLIDLRDRISDGMKKTLVIADETSDYSERANSIFRNENEGLSFDELKSLEVSKEANNLAKSRRAHFLAWILNPIPMLIINRAIMKFDDVVFHSSLKFGIGIFVFPMWWLTIFLLLLFSTGINIALLAVIVMISGLYYSYLR